MAATTTGPIVGLYPVSLTIGTHAPGAPTLALNLLVYAPAGTITGSGEITQALQHASAIPVTKITGKLAHVQGKMQVHLEGTGSYTFPPPAIGTAEGPVEIHMLVDDQWAGHATYTYFGHDVNDVPVKVTH
jgi:Domain of unknown function (DUF1842)